MGQAAGATFAGLPCSCSPGHEGRMCSSTVIFIVVFNIKCEVCIPTGTPTRNANIKIWVPFVNCAPAYGYNDNVGVGSYAVGHVKRTRQFYTKSGFPLRSCLFLSRSHYICIHIYTVKKTSKLVGM
jgi:hypothetical protein